VTRGGGVRGVSAEVCGGGARGVSVEVSGGAGWQSSRLPSGGPEQRGAAELAASRRRSPGGGARGVRRRVRFR
jgi:hypothetical protein